MLLTETAAAQSSVLRGTSAPIPASTVDRAPTVWRPTGVTLTLTGFLYMVDTNRAFVIGTNGTFPVQAGLGGTPGRPDRHQLPPQRLRCSVAISGPLAGARVTQDSNAIDNSHRYMQILASIECLKFLSLRPSSSRPCPTPYESGFWTACVAARSA